MGRYQVSDAGEAVVQRGIHWYRPVSAAGERKIEAAEEMSSLGPDAAHPLDGTSSLTEGWEGVFGAPISRPTAPHP